MPRTLALPLLRPTRLCRPCLAIQPASPHPTTLVPSRPLTSPHPLSLLLSFRNIRHGISLEGGRETEELILATPPPLPLRESIYPQHQRSDRGHVTETVSHAPTHVHSCG